MTNKYDIVFSVAIQWELAQKNDEYDFSSSLAGKDLLIKVNPEFPITPLYTLFYCNVSLDFDNWPKAWQR